MKTRISLTMLLCAAAITAQERHYELNNNQSGATKEYVARDYISLKPGFSYAATAGQSFRGWIDETIVTPPTEATYLKPDGTTTSDPTQGATVGTIPGALDVSPSGAATYTVPIDCPAGINGMQPSLALTYNSQSGAGIAGMCWNLSGLSMISRVPKNFYYDGSKTGIIWDKTSPLALDGQRLIKMQEWGTDSIEYRTESGIEKIMGYNIQSWGPQTFTVYTQDGRKLIYGNAPEIASYYPLKKVGNDFYHLGWMLCRTVDANQSAVHYTYTAAQNNGIYSDTRLSNLCYGQEASNGALGLVVGDIRFAYKTKARTVTQYCDGMTMSNQYILDYVRVHSRIANSPTIGLLHTYQLAYEIKDNNEFLADVKKVAPSGEFLNPITFEWSNPMPEEYDTNNIERRFSYSAPPSYELYGTKMLSFEKKAFGDINGDGLVDVVVKVIYQTVSQDIGYIQIYLNSGRGGAIDYYNFAYEEHLYTDFNPILFPGVRKPSDRIINNDATAFQFVDTNRDGKDELYVGRYQTTNTGNTYKYHIDKYEFVRTSLPANNSSSPSRAIGSAPQDTTSETIVKTSSVYSIDEFRSSDRIFQTNLMVGDFIGDGSVQFMLVYKNENDKRAVKLLATNATIAFNYPESDAIYFTDMNGNGKLEVMYIRGQSINNTYTYFYEYNPITNQFESLFSETSPIRLFEYNQDNDYLFYFGDFNGDGLTDILTKRFDYANCRIFLSTGKGFVLSSLGNNITYTGRREVTVEGKTSYVYSETLIMDINQDGKSDVITRNTFDNQNINIYLNMGNSFEFKTSKIANILRYYPEEVVLRNNGKMTDTETNSRDVITHLSKKLTTFYGISLTPNQRFNKITAITDGLGANQNVTYKNLSMPNIGIQIESNANEVESPITNTLSTDFEVVSIIAQKEKDNGNNLLYKEYHFFNPHIHWKGKGFLGFDSIQIIDKINQTNQYSKYKRNDTYWFLFPYKAFTATLHEYVSFNESSYEYDIPLSETLTNYSVEPQGDKRYWLKPLSSVATDHLKGATATTTYQSFDTDRNPTSVKTDYGNGIYNTQTADYISRGSRYKNKIASKTVTYTAPAVPEVSRTEYSFYDTKGNLTRHTVDSLDVNRVQTFYSNFDAYGNPQTITTKANGLTRSQSLNYETARFVRTRKDDQLNETTTYTYSEGSKLVLSKKVQVSNIAPAHITTYQYDTWGRLRLTTYPDGTKTAKTLQWVDSSDGWAIIGVPADARYYTYAETSGQAPVITYYDRLNRELRTESTGLNNRKIWVDTQYDDEHGGRKLSITKPYFATDYEPDVEDVYLQTFSASPSTSPPLAQSYTYDIYGRPQTVTTPAGTTTYTYNNLSTAVTAPAGTRETTVNAAGWTMQEKTNDKVVNFTHYANGKVRTATPEGGQPLTVSYDLQGNRTKLLDPDAGTVRSAYNGFGELLWTKQKVHTAADTITTTNNYYPSGLLQNTVRNGETTSYTYDPKTRLSTIAIAGKHKQTFTYDDLDRVTNLKEEIDGRTYNQSTQYDPLGRVSRETYPSGYYTENRYDRNGYLTRVTDQAGRLVWQALAANAEGAITREQRGSVTTAHEFTVKGQLERTHNDVFDWSYGYYFDTGNLEYRTDNLTNQKEEFRYDELNRLTHWDIRQNNSLQKENSIVYDALGNIAHKSDLGSYSLSYGYYGKPHALASISGIPASFPAENLAVTYTNFKKIKTLTEGNKFYELTYGVDEQRRKSVYKVNNAVQETRYYIGNYEEEINSLGGVRKIHYLSGGGILIRNNGQDSLLFAYSDNIGSLTTLTDYDGNVVERYAYDPWGKRRNPNNWTQPDSRTHWLTNRGYTGHEMLDAFYIINMNGRVYDPLTAQFFSPDPYLQSPSNWLNYGRYTYCLNNPFKYTDPSGELFWIFPYISFDKGGISFGISAGIGFPKFGVSASLGYSTGDKSFTATAGVSYGAGYAYAGYNTNAGFITGAGVGFGNVYTGSIVSVGSNIMNIGVNYSANGGLSGNVVGFNVSQYGIDFNPSITVGVPMYIRKPEVLESLLDDFDYNKDSKLRFPYENDRQVNDMIKKYIDYNDPNYRIQDITAFEDPGTSYTRDANGYLWNREGQLVGGVAVRYKWITFFGGVGTKIYLSQIRNQEWFARTINHEITHAYMNATYYQRWKGSDADFKKWSEMSAYAADGGSIPAQFWLTGYSIIRPPKLIPVSKFSIY